MRPLVRALVGLIGLVVVAAAGLWLALPALVAPVVQPPVMQPPDNAALLADLRPAAGGAESLQLTAAEVEALSEAVGQRGGAATVWATPGQGSLDLYVDAVVPSSVPHLGGRPVGLQVVATPTVTATGTVTLAVQRVEIGRIRLDAFVPVTTLLNWAAGHAGPPQPWWHVSGASLVVDLAAAPPLNFGTFALRLSPTAVAVTPDALTVTGTAAALVRLDSDTLGALLSGALQAQGAPAAATLNLQQGRGILSLFGTDGAETQFALTPTVPRPGVLHVAVAGQGGAAASATIAGLMAGAAGGAPAWLSADASGLTIDFRAMAPIEVAQGIRLRLLPQSVTVDPEAVQAWVDVQPPAGVG